MVLGGFLFVSQYKLLGGFGKLIFIVGLFSSLLDGGVLGPAISFIPFVGFLFLPLSLTRLNLHSNYYQKIDILVVFSILVGAWIAYYQFGLHVVNLLSQLYLYLIILNFIFIGKANQLTVLLCVSAALISNPGGIGSNRSSVFLLLSLISNENFLWLKNKVWGISASKIFKFMVVITLLFSLVFIIYSNPKFHTDYEEVRFLWWQEIITFDPEMIFYNLSNLGPLLYPFNPHNSFLYMLLYEGIPGLVKVVLFAISSFSIPFGLWLAIFLRSFLDSFFLVGGHGIIFFLFLNSQFFRLKNLRGSRTF
ncbi:hypothetical protein [Synechococcus sp. MIT S9504]|uniref:hypothetical protein n=1 Tax=Synechococcus sp. MIT S9504 TaxID=1801628 RepID=UPI0018D31195|nr:hypothetical protein [Synechococcus sp. MIT S9504]